MKVKVINSQTLSEVKELNLALATRIKGECIVGRSPNAGLVIDSPDVSRLHGKFLYQDGDYYFYDLGSRNGSIVNGSLAQTNQSYKLKAGDVIRIGEFVLTIEEINSVPEDLPETVYKSLDATVFSGLREAANLDIYKIPNQPQEAVNSVSESVIAVPEISEISDPDVQPVKATTDIYDVISFEEITNFQEVTFIQPQEAESEIIAQTPEIMSEVLETTYIQSPELSEELTVSQVSTEIYQPAEEITVFQVSSETYQPAEETTVFQVSTETYQAAEEPIVSEITTQTSQLIEEPTVSEGSTETYQAIEEPIVSEITTQTSQLIEEPTVSEVSTETYQAIEEPIVSEITTQTSQLTEEPTVSEVSTETYQATEEPIVSEITTQTNQLIEEPTVSEVSTETYQATEEPIVSEITTQTSQLIEEPTVSEVSTETYQATEEPIVSEITTQTSQLIEEPTVSEVSTETYQAIEEPIVSEITTQTSQLIEEPTVSEVSTETYQATEEPIISEITTQTSQLIEEPTVSEVSTEIYQAIEEPIVSEITTQTSQLIEEPTVSEVSTETYQATEEPIISEITTQTSQLIEEPTVSENTSSIPEVVSDLTTIETPPEDTYLQAIEGLETTGYVDAIALSENEAVSQVTDTSTIDLAITPVEDVAVCAQAPAEESETEAIAQTRDVKSPNLASLETPENETPQVSSIISTKYVALIAHESKKSDLAKFVAQHQEFFSQCLTLAPPSISQILIQELSISISLQIPATTSGGYQTIASMVASGDILAVILLKDFMMAQSSQANEEALLRVCNINEVLVATNISTAEAIVHYIQFNFNSRSPTSQF